MMGVTILGNAAHKGIAVEVILYIYFRSILFICFMALWLDWCSEINICCAHV